MLVQGQAGNFPSIRQTSGVPNVPSGTFGELTISELNAAYYQLAKLGRLFSLTGAAGNPTAFTGGAAGTPLIGLYNPSGSGQDVVLLQARLGIRTTGTAAGSTDANFWLAAQGSTVPTGTPTVARQMYSGQQSGSVTYGMVNTANTGALASNLIAPSFSFGAVVTTPGVNVTSLLEDIKGAIIVAPGNYLAWGLSVGFTAASLDFGLIWAEIPA